MPPGWILGEAADVWAAVGTVLCAGYAVVGCLFAAGAKRPHDACLITGLIVASTILATALLVVARFVETVLQTDGTPVVLSSDTLAAVAFGAALLTGLAVDPSPPVLSVLVVAGVAGGWVAVLSGPRRAVVHRA